MKKILFLTAFFLFGNLAAADFSPKNWGYQLQNFHFKNLKKAPHEVIVIDAQKDDGTFWSRAEIAEMRKNGKKIIAYFSVGEAENYRFYFDEIRGKKCEKTAFRPFFNPRKNAFDSRKNCRSGNILGAENQHWAGNFAVKFWTNKWQKRAIFPTLEKILAADFDGIYLDKIDAFEDWGGDRTKRFFARKMAKLVADISRTAKKKRGKKFLVLPQNGLEILPNLDPKTRKWFLKSIDGWALESLFFDTTRRDRARRVFLLKKYFLKTKKPIFVVEYSDKKNEKKLEKWRKYFSEKLKISIILFRAENDANLDELSPVFLGK